MRRLASVGTFFLLLLCRCTLLFDLRDLGGTGDSNAGADSGAGEGAVPGGGDGAAGCVRTGAEDCTNGLDDDCNGRVDCADPACTHAGYACEPVPGAPGWLGPAAWYESPPGSPAAPCPAGYRAAVNASGALAFAPADCACTCAASGEECGGTDGMFSSDQACSGVCATVSATAACSPLPANGCSTMGSFRALPPSPAGGACTPEVTKTVTPAAFTTAAHLCVWAGAADVGRGCDPASQCLATPAAPFAPSMCIYHVGDPAPAACPAGSPYASYHVYYAGKSDTRDCEACTCASDTPVGGSCAGTIAVYSDTSCAGTPPMTYAFPNPSCQPYSIGAKPAFVQGTFTLTPGTCSVGTDTQPTGTVQGTGATVVCCLP